MRRSLIIVGLTNMIAQILFARELFATFCGDELSICVFLAAWFLVIAVGGWMARAFRRGREEDSGKNEQRSESGEDCSVLIICLSLIALLIPLELLAIRCVRRALVWVAPSFAFAPEGAVALGPMLCSIFIVVLPLALTVGFTLFWVYGMLAATSGEAAVSSTADGARGTVNLYAFEAAGAVIGGAIYSYILIHLFSSSFLSAALCLSILNLTVAVVLWCRAPRGNPLVGILICPLLFFFVIMTCVPQLNGIAEVLSWTLSLPNYESISTSDTAYGRINVGESEGRYEVIQNGLTLGTVDSPRDNGLRRRQIEALIHIPLLWHPNPRNVLLIGGSNGALREAFKHSMSRIHYVEPDPAAVSVNLRFMNREGRLISQSSRVSAYDDLDARRFVEIAARSNERFDVVIINLPDPVTGLLNRFYTREFFADLKETLGRGGIVSLSLSGFKRTPRKKGIRQTDDADLALRDLTASIHRTLRSVYRATIAIPGSRNIFIASNQSLKLTPSVLVRRLEERGIETEGLTSAALERLAGARNTSIEGSWSNRLNADAAPVSYIYSVRKRSFGGRQSGGEYSRLAELTRPVFDRLFALDLSWFAIGVTILTVIFSLCTLASGRPLKVAAPIAVFCSSLSAAALQIAVIFTFQALYGSIYQHIGIIMTTFMFGATLGVLTRSDASSSASAGTLFLIVQIIIAIYAALLPILFGLLSDSEAGGLSELIIVQIVFPFLSAMPGFLVGAQLPTAARTLVQPSGGGIAVPPTTHLLGMSFGAILCGVVLIPVLGMTGACYAAAIVSLGSAVILLLAHG